MQPRQPPRPSSRCRDYRGAYRRLGTGGPHSHPLSGTSFPLTSLQQAYALGADGVRGITCTTPAVGVIISSGDGSALDPQRFATLIAELTAAWEPLRCVPLRR
ncbi:MAG: hypothetical protein U1U88_001202 [Lawsonella clevelandensis]